MNSPVIMEKISRWTFHNPGKIAVKSAERVLTYQELENRSNRIAHFMHGKIREIPNVIILLDRSAALIETILGILKCGLVFVPVDPFLPMNRVKLMIKESQAEWIITNREYYENFKTILDDEHAGLNILFLDDNPQGMQGIPTHGKNCFYLETVSLDCVPTFESISNPHCYIYFTSGSTGTPKGILGRSEGLAHFIDWEINEFGVNEHFNVSQLTPPSFDVFLRDIFLPLMTGGTCCIPPRHILLDTKRLLEWIDANQITLIHTVPSLFKQLIPGIENENCLESLKYILLAGELLRGRDIYPFTRILKDRIQLINIYGPTETTLAKLFYRVQPGDEERSIIPVGKPIPGAQVFILDSLKQKCRPGDKGEIYIRTPFRSAGYYRQTERTDSVFLKNPFGHHPDDLIYKTGDLGRRLDDGNIEISGRVDFQVKIRGVRIETGEIENRLLTYPGIRDVLVTAIEDTNDEKFLCAYMVFEQEQNIPAADLKKYLAAELPEVMIPTYFVSLDRFPLTSSGKIDRQALPGPVIETDPNYTAPGNEIEKKLVKTWSELLHRDEDKISVLANFFELGGHSLKAAALAAKIHKEFDADIPLAQFFKIMTIRELAQYIQQSEKNQFLEIERTEKKWYYPLSSAQKRLYFLQLLEETGTGYNINQALHLEGKIDVEKLANTFKTIIQRHESFRTSFIMVGGVPVQRIHDQVHFEIEYQAADMLPQHGPTRTFIRAFDLAKAPLIRVGFVKIGAEQALIIVDMHHIISDGVSITLLIKEFLAIYEDRELAPLQLQYKDYASWQIHRKEKLIKQETFWLNELGEDIPVLDIPLDFERPKIQGFAGRTVSFELDIDDTRALNSLALKQGTTLYMVLLAIYNIFLAKITNCEDIIVGTPTAGRVHPGLEQQIGVFINTLALKNVPYGEKSFYSFLEEVKENALQAFENQEYPYEEMVEKLNIERNTGRNPLFDTMFALQNLDFPVIEIPGLKLKPFPYERLTSKLDLTFVAIEMEQHLSFTVEYAVSLFKHETILRFIDYFKKIIAAVLANPFVKISEIEIISSSEKEQLLFHFNNTGLPYPETKTIHQLFAEQVSRTPDHIAVFGHGRRRRTRTNTDNVGADLCVCPNFLHQITYHELNEQSNRLAGFLIEKGVLPDSIVAIMMERSVEMMISILGILKAGGAYLPIDPKLPEERIDYMLKDSNAKVLIINKSEIRNPKSETNPNEKNPNDQNKNQNFGAASVLNLDHLNFEFVSNFDIRASNLLSSNLAYVIYTSGSTGKPKGVMVEHSSVVNLVLSRINEFGIDGRDRILQFSSFSFDASVEQIFVAFTGGAVLVLIDEDVLLDSQKFPDFLARQSITHIDSVPSFLNEINFEKVTGLKRIISGGESCSPELAVKLSRYADFYNQYGPTETTVTAVAMKFKPQDRIHNYVPIGKPIANTFVYICDRFLVPVPIGVTGEMYIGGKGVARGYLNQPELTAEKFDNKYRSYRTNRTYIIYKTGDLARWLVDGNIQFLGRRDQQVKIRGFRIELGEIENRLIKYPGIKQAVVLDSAEKQDKYLCAYVVSDKEYEPVVLREYLAKELPDYMIPSYFVMLDKIPLTANGKIDRRTLPTPKPNLMAHYTAPGNETEKKLVVLWGEILGIDSSTIGIHDNFFHLGGHSLKVTSLASRLYKEFNITVPLVEIFQRPTVRGLFQYIQHAAVEKFQRIEPAEKKEYYQLSHQQKGLFAIYQLYSDSVFYNIRGIMSLNKGTGQKTEQEKKTEKQKLLRVFRELIQRHESLRTSFEIIEKEAVQRIHEDIDFELEYIETGENLTQDIQDFARPFDLSRPPLFRAGLFNSQNESFLIVDMHHIISDGISHVILEKEFLALYDGKELPPVKLHYKDYVQWQHEKNQQLKLKQQEAYWLTQFAEHPPALDLPADFPRSGERNFAGNTVLFGLSLSETQQLKKITDDTETTSFIAVLWIFLILLYRLSGQEEIVIGVAVAGRQHPDLEHIIGVFINSLPLRLKVADNQTALELIETVKQKCLEAFQNQDYPFEDLAAKVLQNRDPGRNPLFDVMLNFISWHEKENTAIVYNPSETYIHRQGTSKFDLSVDVLTYPENVFFSFEYSTQLFKPDTIDKYLGCLKSILTVVLNSPGIKLAEIEIDPGFHKLDVTVFNDDLEDF